MPQVAPEVEAFARIKVIGVGGAGGNAVNHMINSKVRGVEFLAMNTDVQDLHKSIAKKKIHMGKNLTKGLGAGMNPEIGSRAAEETKAEIQDSLKGADMVFIAAGMGGGTGTGAAPVIAKVSREVGALTVAVVTKPFFFEGTQRSELAQKGLRELQDEVDALIVIPNDRLLSIIKKEVTAASAFAMSDEVLRQAVEGISDLITMPGIINVDFADIRAVMQNAGSALMGIGKATGEKRAEESAKLAINSPLLDLSIDGARGVLFAIAGGQDMTMHEINEAAKVITESIDKEAKVIFGAINDNKLGKSEIKVTVIASGFPENPATKTATPDTDESQDDDDDKSNGSNWIKKKSSREPILNTPDERDDKEPGNESEPADNDIFPRAGMGGGNGDSSSSEDDENDWNAAVPAFLRRRR